MSKDSQRAMLLISIITLGSVGVYFSLSFIVILVSIGMLTWYGIQKIGLNND